ncbi:unnamed protein product, partial [Didymodactylos carnosus]
GLYELWFNDQCIVLNEQQQQKKEHMEDEPDFPILPYNSLIICNCNNNYLLQTDHVLVRSRRFLSYEILAMYEQQTTIDK